MQNQPKPKTEKKTSRRGGARPKAGRPRGVPNKASAARERQVAETGATPHEIQIIRMRYYANKFGECVTRGQKGGPGLMQDGRVITAALTESYLDKAGAAADAAAPYVHPRLSAIAIRDFEDWKRAQDAERNRAQLGSPELLELEADEDLDSKTPEQLLALIRAEIGEDSSGST